MILSLSAFCSWPSGSCAAISPCRKKCLRNTGFMPTTAYRGCWRQHIGRKIQAKAAGASSSTFREEQKKHMTTAGFKVRSKSEAMIVEILSSKEIPFQYEEPLTLYKDGNPIIVHPDFTFTNRHGEKIFWEHMGMMDVEEYRKRALDKLAVFWENGIVPPHNLILSSETGDGSLDVATIAMIADMVQKML